MPRPSAPPSGETLARPERYRGNHRGERGDVLPLAPLSYFTRVRFGPGSDHRIHSPLIAWLKLLPQRSCSVSRMPTSTLSEIRGR